MLLLLLLLLLLWLRSSRSRRVLAENVTSSSSLPPDLFATSNGHGHGYHTSTRLHGCSSSLRQSFTMV